MVILAVEVGTLDDMQEHPFLYLPLVGNKRSLWEQTVDHALEE